MQPANCRPPAGGADRRICRRPAGWPGTAHRISATDASSLASPVSWRPSPENSWDLSGKRWKYLRFPGRRSNRGRRRQRRPHGEGLGRYAGMHDGARVDAGFPSPGYVAAGIGGPAGARPRDAVTGPPERRGRSGGCEPGTRDPLWESRGCGAPAMARRTRYLLTGRCSSAPGRHPRPDRPPGTRGSCPRSSSRPGPFPIPLPGLRTSGVPGWPGSRHPSDGW